MSRYGDFFDFALEADDITGDIKNATADVTGNSSDSKDSGDLDLNTNDILGLQSDPDGGTDDGTKGKKDDTKDTDNSTDNLDGSDDTNSEEPKDGANDLENGDDQNQDNSDDNSLGEDPTQDQENQDENSPFIQSRKKKLKQQLLHFYDVLNDSIKLVSSFVPNVSNVETSQYLNNTNKHLLQCKNIIYDILTNQFQELKYYELLKKYVALNNIYSLCIKMVETYFEKYAPEKQEMKKKKKAEVTTKKDTSKDQNKHDKLANHLINKNDD